jgi:hypothetical protein
MTSLSERLTALSPRQRTLLEMKLRRGHENSERDQIVPQREARNFCPLSIDQEPLWFIAMLEPESPAYNLTSASRIEGNLHFDVLNRSFNEIVRRHEILRTTFHAKDGRPYQRIAPFSSFTMLRVNLTSLSEDQKQQAIHRTIREQSQQPFDLSEWPLFRATLVQFNPADHAIVTTFHHIITDWWSYDLLWRELTILYKAFAEHKASPLPDPKLQYADFALWERQWLQGENSEKQFSYWKKQLAGADFTVRLPTDRPRPRVQTDNGKRQFLDPPVHLWDALKKLCQREKTSLYMTLLAAYYVLLHRYTAQEDIVVGSPYANRNRMETEAMMGYFLNLLILRGDISGDPTFLELLHRVRKMTLGAYNNHDVPLTKLLQEFQRERDQSRNPLFQVSYVFTHAQASGLAQSEGLTITPIEVDSGVARFDLTLAIRSGEVNPLLIFEYNTDLFNDSTISRMMGHFQTLLESIVAHPEQRVGDLPMLTEAERRPRARPAPSWHKRATASSSKN